MKKSKNTFSNLDINFLENMFKSLPTNLFFKDTDSKYVFITQYWSNLNDNNDPNFTVKGKTDLEIRKDKENAKKAMEADKRIIESGVGEKYTIKVVNDDKSITYMELTKEPVFDNDGKVIGIVGLIEDVTNQVLYEQNLKTFAQTDGMTKLFNHSYYDYWIENEYSKLNFPVCLLTIDCNGLKTVNDTYGHIYGDEYIKISAGLIRTTLPDSAIIFRTGGDEFVAFIPNSEPEHIEMYINSIKTRASYTKLLDVPISLSCGGILIPEYDNYYNQYLSEADSTMYVDKEKYYSDNPTLVRRKK